MSEANQNQISGASVDVAMLRLRQRFESSGLGLKEVGCLAGYPVKSARKSAWQFLYRTADPRVSMLRKFAAAMRHPMHSLFD